MMPLTKWDLVENPPGSVCFVPSLQHCSSTVLDMHLVHSISNAHLCVWFRWLWSFPDTRTCKFLLQTSTPLLIIHIVKRHFEYFEKSYLFHLQSFDLVPRSILPSCLEWPQSRYWSAMLSNNRRYPYSFGHFSSIASPSLTMDFQTILIIYFRDDILFSFCLVLSLLSNIGHRYRTKLPDLSVMVQKSGILGSVISYLSNAKESKPHLGNH